MSCWNSGKEILYELLIEVRWMKTQEIWWWSKMLAAMERKWYEKHQQELLRKPNQYSSEHKKYSTLRLQTKTILPFKLLCAKIQLHSLKEKHMNRCPKNKNKNIHVLAMWLANTWRWGGGGVGGGRRTKSSHSIVSLAAKRTVSWQSKTKTQLQHWKT